MAEEATADSGYGTRAFILWTLVFVLALLHQDFWLWDDPTLVLGFLPAGLAYHVGYSIVTVFFWLWGIYYAWPEHLEALATVPEAPAAETHPEKAPESTDDEGAA